jgi:hypothetical protein
LAAELVVVVVGVLIALSLEGLRQEWIDRADEHEILVALQREFEANRTELERQFANYDRRLASAQTFLQLGPAAADLPADSAAVIWNWYLRGGTFDPVGGTLVSLLQTGRLELIRDEELRGLLGSWPGRVDNMRFMEVLITDFITKQVTVWLRAQSALPPGGFGLSGVPDGRFPHDASAIHSSVIFENFTRELVAWDLALRLDRHELDDLIDRVLASLTGELAS